MHVLESSDSQSILEKYQIETQFEHEHGTKVSYWSIPHRVDTQYLTHSYFRYIGKFPPQIARYLVQELSPAGGVVVDPMCGGGTTLFEAAASGYPSVGMDVNPVAQLVSRVVCRKLDPAKLSSYSQELLCKIAPESILWGKQSEGVKPLPMGQAEKYFSPSAIGDISSAVTAINAISESEFREFFLVALMSVLRHVSLANIKKMNVEIDETRTNHETVFEALNRKLPQMVDANRALTSMNLAPVRIIDSDATSSWPLDASSADLVIIHPPYLTNTAFSEFSLLQLAVMGVDHKTIWKRELRNRGSYLHEPNGLRKYLVGWNRALEEAYRVLKPGGKCAVVVGDGKIDYVRIPIGSITVEFLHDIGFGILEMARHKLNNNTGMTLNKKMKFQHVVISQK